MAQLRSVAAVLGMLSLCVTAVAEQGKLVLHVADTHGKAVGHLWLSTTGAGGGAKETDAGTGRVLLLLAPETKAGNMVPLQIVRSPQGHDFVMVSPWDGYVRVPPFENSSNNLAEVVVAERGDKEALLVDGRAIEMIAAKINQANAPKMAGKQVAEVSPKESLDAVSKQYGLPPEEVDRAIRAWGEKATDPYDIGLAALYARNYQEATKQLTVSLQTREKGLKSAQDGVVDAAKFLGQSLYAKGRYREAAVTQDQAIRLRPYDPSMIDAKAQSLYQAGDYAEAEPLFRHALYIREKVFGIEHPDTAASLGNLAELLEARGNYAGAEPLFRQALTIQEKLLGTDHPATAGAMDSLAGLLYAKGNYAVAEPLFRRALALREKALGTDKLSTAVSLNNLAALLQTQGDYAGAEPLYRRALSIYESVLGTDHPDTAMSLNNLASLLQAKGDNAGAEPLFRHALAIDDKVLGADHPSTAADLNNLASLLQAKGDYLEAESLYRRALKIREKVLGPNHPSTAEGLNNLASLFQAKGDYSGAEPLYRRALNIREKVLGLDHPDTATSLNNLALLLREPLRRFLILKWWRSVPVVLLVLVFERLEVAILPHL